MEPLHMRIKKALTEKTQTNEIKKILLIDKNKASPLSTALQQEGYHLIHCDSVQKAWDLIYPHRSHLIVLHLYDFNNGAGFIGSSGMSGFGGRRADYFSGPGQDKSGPQQNHAA